jgi:hypothetical protein
MILDTPSYNLITNATLYPLSIPSIGLESTNNGWRIKSGTVSTTATTPPFTLPDPTSFVTENYNHADSLIDNQDLQIYAGYYQSKGSGNTSGYLDYSTYLYGPSLTNTLNYNLNIPATGYRYATFGFRVAANAAQYNFIQFSLREVQQTVTFVNGTDYTKPKIGNTRLYFYYRIEDRNDRTLKISGRSTAWFDATGLKDFSSSDFFDTSLSRSAGTGTTTYASNTYTMNCICNGMNVGASDLIYVYFRVCVPMNETFSFKYVSSKFTAT